MSDSNETTARTREATLRPVSNRTPDDSERAETLERDKPRARFITFIVELRRRRVCRALTMYAVALWLVSQVVDLLYLQLGLPEWTLRFVIIVGLLGLPIILVGSWLLDVTADGVVVDQGVAAHPTSAEVNGHFTADRFIDCGLLLVALVIGVQLALAGIAAAPSVPAVVHQYDRIAVLPFEVASGADAAGLSKGLVAELQHELASRSRLRVIAARKPFLDEHCLSLTGAVAADDSHIRITATLIDSESGEILWTQVFQRDRKGALVTPADVARDIVAAIPLPNRTAAAGGNDNAG